MDRGVFGNSLSERWWRAEDRQWARGSGRAAVAISCLDKPVEEVYPVAVGRCSNWRLPAR